MLESLSKSAMTCSMLWIIPLLICGLSGSEMHFQFAEGFKVSTCSDISENLTLATAKLPEMVATVTRNAVFFKDRTPWKFGTPFRLLNFTGIRGSLYGTTGFILVVVFYYVV